MSNKSLKDLQAPSIPLADQNGIIDYQALGLEADSLISVLVAGLLNSHPEGTTITVYFGNNYRTHIVKRSETYYTFDFKAGELTDGTYSVYYTAKEFGVSNHDTSLPTSVTLIRTNYQTVGVGFGGYLPGLIGDAAINSPVASWVVPQPVMLPKDLTGSTAYLRTPPQKPISLPITRPDDERQLGSVEFSAGQTEATFRFPLDFNLNQGDVVQVLLNDASGFLNSRAADLAVSIRATLRDGQQIVPAFGVYLPQPLRNVIPGAVIGAYVVLAPTTLPSDWLASAVAYLKTPPYKGVHLTLRRFSDNATLGTIDFETGQFLGRPNSAQRPVDLQTGDVLEIILGSDGRKLDKSAADLVIAVNMPVQSDQVVWPGFGCYLPGPINDTMVGTVLGSWTMIEQITLPKGMESSLATLKTPPVQELSLHISRVNDTVPIGTISFSAGQSVGTFEFPRDVDLDPADVLQIILLNHAREASDLVVALLTH